MTDWVRLWHDMPTDPKWRVIARKSGQRIGDVIAVFNFVMVNASANAAERGRTNNLHAEDIAAALDLDDADVSSIINAMIGKVMSNDGALMGWEKRQPKREDNSAERAKRWREERKQTQANATERPETDAETDAETEAEADKEEEKIMPDKPGDYAFTGRTIKLGFQHFAQWKRLFHTIPDLEPELSTIDDWWQAQPPAGRKNWFLATKGMLNKRHQENLATRKSYDRDRITV